MKKSSKLYSGKKKLKRNWGTSKKIKSALKKSKRGRR